MEIVLFTHPPFLGSQSMPRYAKWIADGMKERGHVVHVWTATPGFYNWPVPRGMKKWMGYIDQYIVFPKSVKKKIKTLPKETLFVFADHALGPWVPLVKHRPHVVHCHDFLAQRSALKEISESIVGFSGRLYQSYIRRGYKAGKHFISISVNTQKDLHRFIGGKSETSEVVYNGLTREFNPEAGVNELRDSLSAGVGIDLSGGYWLHVGGNQWYKNRKGVIEIYDEWRKMSKSALPLLMIGGNPTSRLIAARDNSLYRDDIYFLTGKDDGFVKHAYSAATALIFPSYEEGFGWPIIEAMASGCPVITTGEAPMNEVGGSAPLYINRKPSVAQDINNWAKESAIQLEKLNAMDPESRSVMIDAGRKNAQRFNATDALNKVESIYMQIVNSYSS